nr:hypothetical protein Iba_chr02fCG13840 [Ipomoea batatas]
MRRQARNRRRPSFFIRKPPSSLSSLEQAGGQAAGELQPVGQQQLSDRTPIPPHMFFGNGQRAARTERWDSGGARLRFQVTVERLAEDKVRRKSGGPRDCFPRLKPSRTLRRLVWPGFRFDATRRLQAGEGFEGKMTLTRHLRYGCFAWARFDNKDTNSPPMLLLGRPIGSVFDTLSLLSSERLGTGEFRAATSLRLKNFSVNCVEYEGCDVVCFQLLAFVGHGGTELPGEDTKPNRGRNFPHMDCGTGLQWPKPEANVTEAHWMRSAFNLVLLSFVTFTFFLFPPLPEASRGIGRAQASRMVGGSGGSRMITADASGYGKFLALRSYGVFREGLIISQGGNEATRTIVAEFEDLEGPRIGALEREPIYRRFLMAHLWYSGIVKSPVSSTIQASQNIMHCRPSGKGTLAADFHRLNSETTTSALGTTVARTVLRDRAHIETAVDRDAAMRAALRRRELGLLSFLGDLASDCDCSQSESAESSVQVIQCLALLDARSDEDSDKAQQGPLPRWCCGVVLEIGCFHGEEAVRSGAEAVTRAESRMGGGMVADRCGGWRLAVAGGTRKGRMAAAGVATCERQRNREERWRNSEGENGGTDRVIAD